MKEELTLKILAEIAEPGSGHLFSRREAARSAIKLIAEKNQTITELEAALSASIADTAGAKATDEQLDEVFMDWNAHCHGGPIESHRRFARRILALFAAPPASSVADAAGASERERFEAWAIKQGYAFRVYDDFTARPAYNTGLMWAAWKAAIAKETGK